MLNQIVKYVATEAIEYVYKLINYLISSWIFSDVAHTYESVGSLCRYDPSISLFRYCNGSKINNAGMGWSYS
jgi:hypothetical protein